MSVSTLEPLVDLMIEINNSGDMPILESMRWNNDKGQIIAKINTPNWDIFTNAWMNVNTPSKL